MEVCKCYPLFKYMYVCDNLVIINVLDRVLCRGMGLTW